MMNFLFKFRKKQNNVIHVSPKEKLLKGFAILFTLVMINSLLISYFEGFSMADSLWVSMTTITTVGYGDLSASTVYGRLSTIVLLYGGGIFLLAKLSGDFFEIKSEKIRLKKIGKWRFDMQDHIVIMGGSEAVINAENYLIKLIKVISGSPNLKDSKIALLTDTFADGLGDVFKPFSNVALFSEDPWLISSLEKASIETANIVIINSQDPNNEHSDSLVFDAIAKVRSKNQTCFIVTEAVSLLNRPRLLEIGADIVVRPSRSFPEIIVRSIETPGSEQIIEHFLTAELDAYIKIAFSSPITIKWKEVVLALLDENAGLPVAFSHNNNIISNPLAHNIVTMDTLFIMTDKEQEFTQSVIETKLRSS